MEWAKKTYNEQYESWVPWLEDIYLRWFTKDNKASYTTKTHGSHANADICSGNLDKAKVTNIEQVDSLQDGVNDLGASQIGQGGLLQSAGDLVSKQGLTRTERQGKDDQGGYGI
ncbi:hypothetical protein CFAM422_006627 [Trichoderma lentiforme]|uniref:Uncharacterized protein n=1 Tax=Trichoderma lentiforme TaxID=1567552 RepID=A0A9P5CAY9_9HYPO|nr:hypothetical protein CFAM422_006627 [Trichoderma lentiforme]